MKINCIPYGTEITTEDIFNDAAKVFLSYYFRSLQRFRCLVNVLCKQKMFVQQHTIRNCKENILR